MCTSRSHNPFTATSNANGLQILYTNALHSLTFIVFNNWSPTPFSNLIVSDCVSCHFLASTKPAAAQGPSCSGVVVVVVVGGSYTHTTPSTHTRRCSCCPLRSPPRRQRSRSRGSGWPGWPPPTFLSSYTLATAAVEESRRRRTPIGGGQKGFRSSRRRWRSQLLCAVVQDYTTFSPWQPRRADRESKTPLQRSNNNTTYYRTSERVAASWKEAC